MEQLTVEVHAQAAAYTTGLLHLIGCFILARSRQCTAALDPAHPSVAARAQMEQCSIAYPEAGAIALEKWGFPPQITVPIRRQLEPVVAGEHGPAAALLTRAAGVALEIEASRPGSPMFSVETAMREPDELTRSVETASTELLNAFHPGAVRRPAWADRPLKPVQV